MRAYELVEDVELDESLKDFLKKIGTKLGVALLGGFLASVPMDQAEAGPSCQLDRSNDRVICMAENGQKFWVGTKDRNGNQLNREQMIAAVNLFYQKAMRMGNQQANTSREYDRCVAMKQMASRYVNAGSVATGIMPGANIRCD